jgi:steroid delta-isomerase-like uncharacterized protein
MSGTLSERERLEASKALIRAHYDAVTNGFDPDSIRAQVTEDFYDHAAGAVLGPEGTIAHARGLHAAFEPFHATIDDIVAEGDRVAARVTWQGVHVGPFRGLAPTNRKFTFTGMTFWRIAHGRIAERWAEVDTASLMRQLTG